MKKFNQFIFESKQTDKALELLANAIRGTRYEHKVFLVGGFVRDSILGRDSKDIDLVVDDEGLDGGIRCASFIAKSLGIFKEGSNPVIYPRFGTAKLSLPMVNNYEVEFVAPRKEIYTPGSRKPLVSAGTLSDDAFRRDFTINALFRKLTTGELRDLTGMGLKDLENKLIRTSSDPDFIFKEDPLRILRAIRFTFKYEFDMPLSLIRAIKRNADKLRSISAERISDELNKILVIKKPSSAIRLFQITGVLDVIMPELSKLVNLGQNKYHNKDAFKHTLNVLDNTPPDLTTRLAALFHDVGKSVTRTEKDGKVQFIGHENVGSELTAEIMRRLKYSTKDIETVTKIVKHHMYLKFGGDMAVNLKDKHIRTIINKMADTLEPYLNLVHADNIAHAPGQGLPNQIDAIRKRIAGWDLNTITNVRSPLDGNEIMAMGAVGRQIGKIKSKILEKVIENPNFTKQDAINLVKSMLPTLRNI